MEPHRIRLHSSPEGSSYFAHKIRKAGGFGHFRSGQYSVRSEFSSGGIYQEKGPEKYPARKLFLESGAPPWGAPFLLLLRY
jgi:hypothetical protein